MDTAQHAQQVAEQIQQRLIDEVRPDIVVASGSAGLILSGTVRSASERERAAKLVTSLAEGIPVENNLEVEHWIAEELGDLDGTNGAALDAELSPARDPDELDARDDISLESLGLDGSLTDLPLEEDATSVVNPSVYDDIDATEEDPSYMAPTDPVTSDDADGNLTVNNGFAPTALMGQETDPSVEDRAPGDEALTDRINAELHEDAATTDLEIDVTVQQGVARLRGTVPDLVDAENAEAVAADVPGVQEVRENLDVQSMQ